MTPDANPNPYGNTVVMMNAETNPNLHMNPNENGNPSPNATQIVRMGIGFGKQIRTCAKS